MDADTAAPALPRPSEEQAALDPAARAGSERLEACLTRLTPDQRDAFRAAVRRCYGSAAGT